jgi:dihydroxyacetone kinase-like protein
MAPGPTARVLVDDDVAVERSTWSTGRRGVAGTMVVEKILGAAAEAGMALDALATLGASVNARTRSMGVALTSCVVPAAGTPTFTLAEDEMEMGVGIHGEPGRRRVKLASANAIAEEMLGAILGDLAPPKGAPCLLLVNGFGGTPLMELYLLYHAARTMAEAKGLTVARSLVGNHVTSLEMAGGSITLAMLDEADLARWDAPVHTAALRWGA